MPKRLPQRQPCKLLRAAALLVPFVALFTASLATGQGQYYWQPEIWHGNRRVTPDPTIPTYSDQEVVARQIIAEAQQRVRARDFIGARRLAEIASQLHVVWHAQEETPQSLLRLLQSLPMEASEVPGPQLNPELSMAAGQQVPEANAEMGQSEQSVPLNQLRTTLPHESQAVPGPEATHINGTPTTDGAVSAGTSLGDSAEFARTSFTVSTRAYEGATDHPSAQRARSAPPEWTDSAPAPLSYQQAVELFQMQSRGARQGDSALGTLSSFTLGFLFAVAVLVIVALFLLRGLSNRDGAIFRVELVNTGSPLIQAQPYLQPGLAGEARAATSVSDESNEPFEFDQVPLPFESVGPTFAERQREAEEQTRRTEEAMLKHIFEQNVQLRQDLMTLQPAA